MLDPTARPAPQVPALLRALRDHRVDWVLSGSAVLALYGADLRPNDLDVVPSLEPDNLARLAGLLAELDAVPANVPDWTGGLSVAECLAWRPEPASEDNLDHLFVTRLGMLDIPPRLTGTHARLRAGATVLEVAGVAVWVCDPDEVLARLAGRARAKDLKRAQAYAELRDRLRTDRTPRGLGGLG